MMSAVVQGNFSTVMELAKTPICPFSLKPERYVLTVALMIAMQEERMVTDPTKKNNLIAIITWLLQQTTKDSLLVEVGGVSPVILAQKWKDISRKVSLLVFNRLNEGGKKRKTDLSKKVDWDNITLKANEFDKEIDTLELLGEYHQRQPQQSQTTDGLEVHPTFTMRSDFKNISSDIPIVTADSSRIFYGNIKLTKPLNSAKKRSQFVNEFYSKLNKGIRISDVPFIKMSTEEDKFEEKIHSPSGVTFKDRSDLSFEKILRLAQKGYSTEMNIIAHEYFL